MSVDDRVMAGTGPTGTVGSRDAMRAAIPREMPAVCSARARVRWVVADSAFRAVALLARAQRGGLVYGIGQHTDAPSAALRGYAPSAALLASLLAARD